MSRPRGFAPWRPQHKTLVLLTGVQDVLDEYKEHLPLTIRQIFYRLVGKDLIGKSEKQYSTLCEMTNRARRGGKIGMNVIRDDGFTGSMNTGAGWNSPTEWIESLIDSANRYGRDRQEGQKTRLLVWCEATGMVPQLERVARPYGISVASSGGFDSLTVKHEAGESLGTGEPVEILHVGDWDPSGECMFDALAEDIAAFAEHYSNEVGFSRIAVTPEQVIRYSLPTAPPKASTHQAKKCMIETVQAEALDPATLAGILRDGIEARMDLGVYRQVVERESTEREALKSDLRRMIAGGAT